MEYTKGKLVAYTLKGIYNTKVVIFVNKSLLRVIKISFI